MLVDDLLRERHQMKQQRAGDVVRQIAHDTQRRQRWRTRFLLGQRQGAEIESQRVAGMQLELGTEALLQPRYQVAVELDCMQFVQAFDQWTGQGPQAWADFDHTFARTRRDGIDDRIDDTLVDQKVLAEALARVVSLMLSAGHERSLIQSKKVKRARPLRASQRGGAPSAVASTATGIASRPR